MKPIPFRISVCLCVSAIILAASCTKTTPPPGGGSGSGTPNPTNGNFLSSIRNSVSGISTLDSFTYDNSNRLISIIVPNNGGQTTTFTYSGSSPVPASYKITNSQSNEEDHQLWYDGQNRIIKDSTLSGSLGNAGNVTYYSYANGIIVAQTVGKNGPSAGQVVDSAFLSNGNVASLHTYEIGATGTPQDTVLDSVQFTYNSIVNPAFHQSIASTIGPLLTNVGGFDFVSGYGVTTAKSWSKVGSLATTTNIQTYSWTLDSKGRGATETITDSKAGVVDSFSFNYY
jgi:hypothetical protein